MKLLVALFAVAGVALGQMNGDIILLDDNIDDWYGLTATAEEVALGQTAAEWASPVVRPWVECPEPPMDWTPFAALSLQVHSARANGQLVCVRAYTEDPTTSFASYAATFTVTWEGWRTVVLPLWDFRADDDPAGWDHITHVNLVAGGDETEALEDTRLILDDIRLTVSGPPEAVLLEDDLSAWPQLRPLEGEAHSGALAGDWGSPVQAPWVERHHPPRDWTPYGTLHLAVYSATANGQEVRVRAYTGDPATSFDSYYAVFYLDWEGWREVDIPLSGFAPSGHPAGWDHITVLTLCAGGAEVVPMLDTRIALDDIRLIPADAP